MSHADLTPVRIEENGPSLLIAGLSETYSFGTPMDAASQWQRFAPHVDTISRQQERTTYGL